MSAVRPEWYELRNALERADVSRSKLGHLKNQRSAKLVGRVQIRALGMNPFTLVLLGSSPRLMPAADLSRLARCTMRIIALTFLLIAALSTPSFAAPPSPEEHKAHIAKIPSCFATLERFRVTIYQTGFWNHFVYDRGSFTKGKSVNPDGSKPKPFDAQAEADFSAIEKALAETGVALRGIKTASYDSAGKLQFAEFTLRAQWNRYSYVYSPGYKSTPADIPKELEHTRIDGNWYFVWEDWN